MWEIVQKIIEARERMISTRAVFGAPTGHVLAIVIAAFVIKRLDDLIEQVEIVGEKPTRKGK